MVIKEVQKSAEFVKWFSELSNKDIGIAGGKGASLSEMYNSKFPIPPGFIITAQAYDYFLDKTGLKAGIKAKLSDLDIEDTKKLEQKAKEVREMIENAEMPMEMQEAITEAYDILDTEKVKVDGAKKGALDILKNSHEPPFVAVRSSATTEDLADASFAGQQESFLNVKGKKELIKKVKECQASLFTARAVYYRTKKGFDHAKSLLSVVVQKMIDSDKSGVMFSRNPISDKGEIVIESVWGLGEGIVSGAIKPDHYEIDSNLEKFNLLACEISNKKTAYVRNAAGENQVVKLNEERANQQVLNNSELRILANYARKLEEHYKKPQDIEFAISGGEIYIVQSRPITTKFNSEKRKDVSGKMLLSGLGASPGIGTGVVKIIHDLNELDKIKKGDVLVTEMTNPDMVVSMQKAAAIVTNEGGITSHAAIVSREMGIPCVVGTGNATETLVEGTFITVDGNVGKVYEGKGEAKAIEVLPIVPTKTKIKVIVDLPDFAERAAKSNSKAVGLVRLEGIIAESGKHPMYFVEQNKMKDYVKVIYSGIKKIAAHFDEVWVRTSDIRSDEYNHLQGAPQKVEGNPMLGNHGIRFSLKHKEIIKAEVEALKMVALEFPSKKLGVMSPQIISVNEFEQVKDIATQIKIPANVKLGIMVETPAAVQIINELCEAGIQFVSFGTNDLTQYMLAIDRNNEDIQDLYDETNPAVISAIKYVIRRCKKYKVETSICGQAGSREDMVKILVAEGIDSISTNADAAKKVSEIVAKVESEQSNVREHNFVEDIGEKKYETSMIKKEEMERNEKEIRKIPEGMEKSVLTKDIEEIILKELDDDSSNFIPNSEGSDNDVPALNDAIPIDSEHFNSPKNDKEIDLN